MNEAIVPTGPVPVLQLNRLRVEQVRQFRQPFELADLQPGLNLFAGPNEAGKSTLVRALRAAFFERHRSTAVEDLRPWGDSAASPTVALDFHWAGQPYQLFKSFLGRKRCSLQIGVAPGRTLEGPEAEDHLARLFGFVFAGRGASQPEHWGIPGLLWVEQGSGHELDVRHAREHLHDALQGLGAAGNDGTGDDPARELAATGGDDLLDTLRSQRAELLTATGRPRAALAEAATQQEQRTLELTELDRQIDHYRQQVDQLASLRAAQQADDAERPWELLRRQLADAQARQQALAGWQKALADDRQRLQALARHQDLLHSQLQTFEHQEAQARQRQDAWTQATAQQEVVDTRVQQARLEAESASGHHRAAEAVLHQARQRAQRASLEAQCQDARASEARGQADLTRAEQAQQRLLALEARAADQAVSPAEVAALRPLERQLRELTVQRDAVATRLSFALAPGVSVELHPLVDLSPDAGRVAPDRLTGEGSRLLDGPARWAVPGVGEFTLHPGGGQDVSALEHRRGQAQAALQSALRALACADVAEAEARLAAHLDLQGQLALARQAVALVAPQGLETLRAAVQQAGARAAAAQLALERCEADPAAATSPAPPDLTLPDVPEAQARLDLARTHHERARHALQQAQQQQAAALGRLAECQREHAAADAVLADPERQHRLAEARSQGLAVREEAAALAERVARREAELAQARPDIVAQDIQRLQRSIDQLLTQQQQRREAVAALDAALQSAGAQGLEARRDQVAGELHRAGARLQQLQRRADALDLLCQMLTARRQATLSRLQAPLQRHLQRYLSLLFPGAQLHIDDQLAPASLSRPLPTGASVPSALPAPPGAVRELSFGAREQLGLISRLAYADLLREAGRPTLIILDDALVHSDASRLAQMKRVLFDAAQRHQLLLFTCHPEDWRDLGVVARPIA